MKRIITSICAVAIAAGLLAAPASAGIKHFKGHVDGANGGGTVKFDVLFENGKPKTAGLFIVRWPVTCSHPRGITHLGGGTQNVVEVTKQREFHYDFNFGNRASAAISGTIGKNGKKAFGRTRFSGDPGRQPPFEPRCTTGGRLHWTARSVE